MIKQQDDKLPFLKKEISMDHENKKNIPTMIPYLTVCNAKESISFYEKAFGFGWLNAAEADENGDIQHAEMSYKDILIMFAPEGAWGDLTTKAPITTGTRSPMSLYLYCDDLEALYQQAIKAGAKSIKEPFDAFWGDRVFQVSDTNGYEWMFAKSL